MGGRAAEQEKLAKPVRVVAGGDSRQQSVENALATVDPKTDLVAVHDAVRPFIDLTTIDKVIDEAVGIGRGDCGDRSRGHGEAGGPRAS